MIPRSANKVVTVEQGGRVLLRVINGSAMSNYHVDLGDLDADLIAVDGCHVVPMWGRVFPITTAQRLDIKLTVPQSAAAYPILAKPEGERMQTGIILRAGQGQILRIPEMEEIASPPITLSIESWLRAAAPLKPRAADLSYTLNLTGSMEGYRWSINHVAWSPEVPPLSIVEGERVSSSWSTEQRWHTRSISMATLFKSWLLAKIASPGRFATRCWSPRKRL